MVRAAALALVLIASPLSAQDEWEEFRGTEAEEWPGAEVAWSFVDVNGSLFYVLDSEVERSSLGSRTFWIHGQHEADSTVAYRASVTYVTFNCRGYWGESAFTTYHANGDVLETWDGAVSLRAIRPRTMQAALEAAICAY